MKIKPIMHKLPSGKELPLYSVNTFAKMINRDTQTVKRWEKEGTLPIAPFSIKRGAYEIRLYPEYFINSVKHVIKICRIRSGKPFDKLTVKAKIYTEVEKAKAKLI